VVPAVLEPTTLLVASHPLTLLVTRHIRSRRVASPAGSKPFGLRGAGLAVSSVVVKLARGWSSFAPLSALILSQLMGIGPLLELVKPRRNWRCSSLPGEPGTLVPRGSPWWLRRPSPAPTGSDLNRPGAAVHDFVDGLDYADQLQAVYSRFHPMSAASTILEGLH
jgi:hypothetical protein